MAKHGSNQIVGKNKGSGLKPFPAATSNPKDSAMIGGVANGRPLTRTARKGKGGK